MNIRALVWMYSTFYSTDITWEIPSFHQAYSIVLFHVDSIAITECIPLDIPSSIPCCFTDDSTLRSTIYSIAYSIDVSNVVPWEISQLIPCSIPVFHGVIPQLYSIVWEACIPWLIPSFYRLWFYCWFQYSIVVFHASISYGGTGVTGSQAEKIFHGMIPWFHQPIPPSIPHSIPCSMRTEEIQRLSCVSFSEVI